MPKRSSRPLLGVHTDGLPDGFYFKNVLWFGDGNNQRVPIARGFEVVPTDPTGLGHAGLATLRQRLRQTLAMLGTDTQAQIRWTIDSDYRGPLIAYDRVTEQIEEQAAAKEAAGENVQADVMQIYHRRDLSGSAWKDLHEGILRRERLHLYIGRELNLANRKEFGRKEYATYVERLARDESARLEETFVQRLRTIHPDASVHAMTDAEHFLRAEYFHDPLRSVTRDDTPLHRFRPEQSICMNSFVREWGVPQGEPGVSYVEGGVPHAMLALLVPPRDTWPAEVPTLLRELSFHELEVILNIKQLNADSLVARLEKESGETAAVLNQRGHMRAGENSRLDDKTERLLAYRRGDRAPYSANYCFHLWAPSIPQLRRRVEDFKKVIEAWGSANATLITLPGSVRHTYSNAWPGWWCGTLGKYAMEIDDINLADMIPWSSTFVGEPEGAEAMFRGERNSLVFVRTRSSNGQPRHALTFGMTGSGKTTLTNDLHLQIRHSIDFMGICESGRSLIMASALEGHEPLVISARGTQTLNPFDPCGTPLGPDFFGLLSHFIMGRIGVATGQGSNMERIEASHIKGIIDTNLHAFYTQVFRGYVRDNGQLLDHIRRFAVLVHSAFRQSVAGGESETTLSDVAADFQSAIESGDADRQAYAAEDFANVSGEQIRAFTDLEDSQDILRDLSFMFMRSEDVPTLSQFRDMLHNTPASDRDTHELCRKLANMLTPWCARGGSYGPLFDGVSTVRITGRRFHVETGEIGDGQQELRDATNSVVAGMMLNYIKRLPRAQRKWIHFPELAEILATPGGETMVKLLSTQIRKYNGVLSAEIQQYDLLRKSNLQTTIWGNSPQRYFLWQPDPDDTRDMAERARLSPPHTRAIQEFHPADSRGAQFLLNIAGSVTGPAICRPSAGLLYMAESSGKIFDERRQALRRYRSLAEGLITEGEAAKAEADNKRREMETGVSFLAGLRGRPTAARELLHA